MIKIIRFFQYLNFEFEISPLKKMKIVPIWAVLLGVARGYNLESYAAIDTQSGSEGTNPSSSNKMHALEEQSVSGNNKIVTLIFTEIKNDGSLWGLRMSST